MDKNALSAWLISVALSISDELKNARNSSLRYLISEAKILSVIVTRMPVCPWIRCVRVLVCRIPIFHLFLRRKPVFHLSRI